jgi:hypothetical protein
LAAFDPAATDNGRSGNGHTVYATVGNGSSNGNGAPAAGGTGGSAVPAVDGAPVAAAGPGSDQASGPGIYGEVSRGDGVGLAQVVVTVADPTGRQEARATTGPDGEYRVALRTGGTYLVVAAAGTYQPHAALVAVADRPARHDVALTGTSGVVGFVHTPDPAGGTRMVPGATVTLIDVGGDVAGTGVADHEGRYRLAGVPDGAYTLTASSPGHQPVAVSLRLEVGATVERDLELPRRSRLVGTVTAASSGRGVGEAIATLVDRSGTVVGSTVTGPDGSFVFDDLAEGTYTLTASGYAPVAQVVQVTAGAEASALVALGTPAGQAPPTVPTHVVEPLDAGGPR